VNSPTRVVLPQRGRMRIVGVHILHASVGAPKKRFARSLCGNSEWSLRPHAPMPAFLVVVGWAKALHWA